MAYGLKSMQLSPLKCIVLFVILRPTRPTSPYKKIWCCPWVSFSKLVMFILLHFNTYIFIQRDTSSQSSKFMTQSCKGMTIGGKGTFLLEGLWWVSSDILVPCLYSYIVYIISRYISPYNAWLTKTYIPSSSLKDIHNKNAKQPIASPRSSKLNNTRCKSDSQVHLSQIPIQSHNIKYSIFWSPLMQM